MGTHFKQGFTIIETMLVLAISGSLVVALLVGVGSTINTQRYRDSVVSFKALLQDQYSQIDNIRNDREGRWTCNQTASPADNGDTWPGQSECVILGRYISVQGGEIKAASVVGYKTSETAAANDVAQLANNYALGIASDSIDELSLEWGAVMKRPNGEPGGSNISILLLRSPESGNTYTFQSQTVPAITAVNAAFLKTMVLESTAQQARTLCVVPTGVTFIPEVLAISIAESASGPSAIEVRTNQNSKDAGSTSVCSL